MNNEFSPLSRKPIPVELDPVNAERVRQRTEHVGNFGAIAVKGHDANTLGADFAEEPTNPDLITELPFDVSSRPDLRVVPDLIEMPDHLKPLGAEEAGEPVNQDIITEVPEHLMPQR